MLSFQKRKSDYITNRQTNMLLLVLINFKSAHLIITENNILREKSLAIYFEDSQLRRNRTFNFIVSKLYVDKRSRVR